jgi:hypothetical protein
MADEVLRLRATVVSDEALADIRRIGREIGLVQHMGGKGAAQAATGWQQLGKSIKSVGTELLGAVPALGGFGLGAAGAGVAAYKLVNTLGDISKGILDLKNTSKDLGLSTSALKSFSIEAQKAGVAPEAMAQGLKNFKRNTEDFTLHIGNLRTEMIKMGAGPVLDAINNATTTLDKLKAAYDFKEVLNREDPSGVKAQRFFEMLGLGAETARLKWSDLVKTMNEQQPITDEQVAKAKAYQDALIKLGGTWDDLKTTVGTKLFSGVAQDLKSLTELLDVLNQISNWKLPSWLPSVPGPGAMNRYIEEHTMGFDPFGLKAKHAAERAEAEKNAPPVAPAAPRAPTPEEIERKRQADEVLKSVSPSSTAPATGGWRHMLHLSAASDDFHQYISKASDIRDFGSKVGGALMENPAGSAVGATGNAMMMLRYWPQIRALMMGGGGAAAGGIGAAGAVMWPKPAETGELPERFWPKSGPGVSKIAFGGGDTGGGESGATRIIRVGVFQGMVDFKSYMQAGATVSGGDGGGMITKASWGGTGGGGGGGPFGLGGGGGGAGGGLHSGGGFTALGGSSGGGGASGTYGGGGGASAPLTGGGSMTGGAGGGGAVPTGTGSANPTLGEMIADARQRAVAHGVDPDVATGIIMGESGLHKPGERRAAWGNNDPSRSGRPGTSYGAFQLRTPGLGSEFIKQTGLPLNASTWQQQQEFAISQMAQHGDKWTRGTWSSIPDAEKRGTNVRAMGQRFMSQFGGQIAQPNGQANATPAPGAYTGDRRLPNAKSVWGENRADPRIAEIVSAAAEGLPPGYKIQMTSAGRDPSRRGFHPRGMAEDFQIIDPHGRAVNNRGWDETGLYKQLAQNAYGYQEKMHPELTGKFQWGGQFGTQIGGGGVPDLMHFDIGGRRGNYRQFSREAIGATLPPTVSTARIDGAVGAQASSGSVNVTVNSNGTKAEASAKTDGKLFQPPVIKQHKQMQRTDDVGVNV